MFECGLQLRAADTEPSPESRQQGDFTFVQEGLDIQI